MFAPTGEQIALIRRTVREILDDPSNESFARAWLVWAELQIHTLNHPNKVEVVTRMMPLVMAVIAFNPRPPEEAQKILHRSVLRALFQAKLDGRDSLEMQDAKKAVLYVKDCSLK